MRILLFLVIGLVLISCGPPPATLNDSPVSYQAELGDYLRFPDGWTPVMFTAIPNGYHGKLSGYLFICERDGIYRYCTPRTEESTHDNQ